MEDIKEILEKEIKELDELLGDNAEAKAKFVTQNTIDNIVFCNTIDELDNLIRNLNKKLYCIGNGCIDNLEVGRLYDIIDDEISPNLSKYMSNIEFIKSLSSDDDEDYLSYYEYSLWDSNNLNMIKDICLIYLNAIMQ